MIVGDGVTLKSTTEVDKGKCEKSWLRLSEQFPANDKWCSAGFRSLEGAGCWV
jgi:hypothetical protein